MTRAFAVYPFLLTLAYSAQLSAAPAAAPPSATPTPELCQAGCAASVLIKPVEYSKEIARGGEFSADVTIQQPCACVRRLNLNLAFAEIGASSAHERSIPLQVAQGSVRSHVVLSAADLSKAKVKPGQFTVGFGLRDERDQPLGEAISGLPFKYGTTVEALPNKPVLPASIGRESELAVPFMFANKGDIPAHVTALVVFTRPDETQGLEYYSRQLAVAPGGTQHIVRLNAAKRKTLQIGPGPWLVTTAAFDAFDRRLAFFPGHLLMIGKTLSQPAPARASASPIESTQDLELNLTFKNDGDVQDLVTAVLLFTAPGQNNKPIEYKIEGLKLPVGTSTHPIHLTPQDRYNLGVRPGRWRVSTTALDRAGKRLETQRGTDIVINGAP
jgi:hypothetical protein